MIHLSITFQKISLPETEQDISNQSIEQTDSKNSYDEESGHKPLEIEITLRRYPGQLRNGIKTHSLPHIKSSLSALTNIFPEPKPTITAENEKRSGRWLLLVALLLGIFGQISFTYKIIWLGALFYLSSVIIAMLYARGGAIPPLQSIQSLLTHRRLERILLIVILIIAIFSRFYLLMDKPYGYEADGTRVAGHTYFAYFAHEPGEMTIHFESQPTSFFLQYLAMLIGSISFTSTRVLSAILGSLSVFLFYFILRRLFGSYTALLGTFFYAIGFTALYAARQTHIETAIEIWVLLTYFLFIEAVYREKYFLLFLASLSTIAGMLCFESFYMTPIIVVIFLVWMTFIEKQSIKILVKQLLIYIVPMLPIVPMVYDYTMSRTDYHFEPMVFMSAGFTMPPFLSRLAFMGISFLESLQTLFYQIRYTDSLLTWPGPIINPLLLPISIIGLAIIIATPKNGRIIFLAIWFLLQYFPFAVLGAPYPRVLYPGVIPIYGLAAFGLCVIWVAFYHWFRQHSSLVLPACLILFLGLTWYLDQNIFWYQVFDPDNRQKRHEQSDLIMEGLQKSSVLYLPYMPFTTDDIPKEKSVNAMSAGSVVGAKNVDNALKLLPMSELMPAINSDTQQTSLSFLFEKLAIEKVENRSAALHTVQRCYPNHSIKTGRYFDLITINDTRANLCYSIFPPSLIAPNPDQEQTANSPVEFTWQMTSKNPMTFQIALEQKRADIIWVEAEIMIDQGGWFRDTVLVDSYSGSGYLTDFWQATKTSTSFNIEYPQSYQIWVKSYKRRNNDQQNYLAIDQLAPQAFATGGENVFSQWVWENIGEYQLDQGSHELTLSRTYGADPHFQVFIDEIAISPDPNFDPNKDQRWRQIFISELQTNAADHHFTYPDHLPSGTYRWNVKIFDGDRLVDWLGNKGVSSPYSEFTVSE